MIDSSFNVVTLLVFSLLVLYVQSEIVIGYENIKDPENSYLKFYHNITDGYYLEMGGYDPIDSSTTC